MLLDRFRGPVIEEELCTKLTEIYKSMFEHTGEIESDEIQVLEELKNEFVQEELEWYMFFCIMCCILFLYCIFLIM